ncbi:MAG: class I SAM-dependent methyltransferase [Vicinamibacteria bacterium]|nr:class I SAM-dependent methyltransferase [Vicinamibacteria bacterium]
MVHEQTAVTDERARLRLNRYLDCLLRWAPRINLTGAEKRLDAFEMLVLPILGAEGLLVAPLIDVGSGNGSPGLILAALRPDLAFTLLEPRAKRWAFLREAAREMGSANVTVLRERSEAYRGPRAAMVTMRAVGLAPESLRPLLLPGGSVLVFGGPPLRGAEVIPLRFGSSAQRRCFT